MSLSDMRVYGGSRALTPQELGAVFANMASDEQAEFWNGVADATKAWPDNHGYSYGEAQWCALRRDMLKPENKEGLAAAQSWCAWMLLHAWRTVEPW